MNTDIQIDRQTDRQADRQTDRQIDRQADRQTDRLTDWQTVRQTENTNRSASACCLNGQGTKVSTETWPLFFIAAMRSMSTV